MFQGAWQNEGIDVPAPEGEVQSEAQSEIGQPTIRSLMDKIKELESKLNQKYDSGKEEKEKLKPIEMKDIEKPDKYDNNTIKFNTWFDKFRDLFDEQARELV